MMIASEGLTWGSVQDGTTFSDGRDRALQPNARLVPGVLRGGLPGCSCAPDQGKLSVLHADGCGSHILSHPSASEKFHTLERAFGTLEHTFA